MKQRKVKAVLYAEIWHLYYLNNRLITTFTSLEDVSWHCKENNLNLDKITGLDED